LLSSSHASKQENPKENPRDDKDDVEDYFGFKSSTKKAFSTNGDGSQKLALQYDEKLAKVHDLKCDASTKIK
jgi:hypothetical protein